MSFPPNKPGPQQPHPGPSGPQQFPPGPPQRWPQRPQNAPQQGIYAPAGPGYGHQGPPPKKPRTGVVVAALVALVLVFGVIGWVLTSGGGSVETGGGTKGGGTPKIGETVNVKAGDGRADVTITGSTRTKGRDEKELLVVGVEFVGTSGDAATGNAATCKAPGKDYLAVLGGMAPEFQTGEIAKPGQRFAGVLAFEVPPGTTCDVSLFALAHETIRVPLPLEPAGKNPLAMTTDTKRVRVGEPVPVKVATGQQTMTVQKMSWGTTPEGAPGLAVDIELSCTSGMCSALTDEFVVITPTRRVWAEADQYKELASLSPGDKERVTYYFPLAKEGGTMEFGTGMPDYPDVPEFYFAIPLPS
ncbi:hypothetical protein GCM10027418_26310 [Mariniluteicoccus endophyticus]